MGGAKGTESPLENQQLHGFQWGFSPLNPTQENKPPGPYFFLNNIFTPPENNFHSYFQGQKQSK